MRLVRFKYKGKESWGIARDELIKFLKNSPFTKLELTGQVIPFHKVKLLPPAAPTKIILVGLNYRDHAKELKMSLPRDPIIFLKPPSSLIAHGEKIIYPRMVKRLDYEAELALVISKKARDISAAESSKYILGYTCLNDITARDLQKKDGQWSRAKSFDTFCPVGPWVETEINPDNLRVSCRLNGGLKQDSCTSNFIFPVDYLVAFISRIMTLYPGDIISTGTPKGVGRMRPGDKVEVLIEGIGGLKNQVVS